MITARFGTFRGLVRLALSYPQLWLRQSGSVAAHSSTVRRLVFVCQGNICRSAFADIVARQAGLNSASFGLSTTTGRAAHEPAISAAQSLGYDLSRHAAINMADYAPQDGDLLLAMEVRQLRRLANDPRLASLPRMLLGRWTSPLTPHLHDPYGLDDRYMRRCLGRIEKAVGRLAKDFPGARIS